MTLNVPTPSIYSKPTESRKRNIDKTQAPTAGVSMNELPQPLMVSFLKVPAFPFDKHFNSCMVWPSGSMPLAVTSISMKPRTWQAPFTVTSVYARGGGVRKNLYVPHIHTHTHTLTQSHTQHTHTHTTHNTRYTHTHTHTHTHTPHMHTHAISRHAHTNDSPQRTCASLPYHSA